MAASAALIPAWCRRSHPLNLPSSLRRQISSEYDPRGIFLNIPYSKTYSRLEVAVLSTVTAYGLVPYRAKDEVGFGIRIHKISRQILTCRFGFADLTYATRLNIPLELGLQLAWGKETFVVSKTKYANLKSVSDLNFGDIRYHEGSLEKLVRQLSRWIEQYCSKKRYSVKQLMVRCAKFQQMKVYLGEDFDRLTPDQLAGMVKIAKAEYSMDLDS